jgi:hypothetical protein
LSGVIVRNFLLKIADYNIKRAAREKVGSSIVEAGPGELRVGCGARKVSDNQDR